MEWEYESNWFEWERIAEYWHRARLSVDAAGRNGRDCAGVAAAAPAGRSVTATPTVANKALNSRYRHPSAYFALAAPPTARTCPDRLCRAQKGSGTGLPPFEHRGRGIALLHEIALREQLSLKKAVITSFQAVADRHSILFVLLVHVSPQA